jgi:hypothetical protein
MLSLAALLSCGAQAGEQPGEERVVDAFRSRG